MSEVDTLRSQIELNKIHISKVKKEADQASLADEITKKASASEEVIEKTKTPSKEEDEYTEVASNAPTDTLKEALKETLNEPFPQVTHVYRYVRPLSLPLPRCVHSKYLFGTSF